jgi:FAD/FMN-containing dehydrogenase
MLSLSPQGVLTAEAGVSLGDIVRTFLPRGWTLPVTPGTQWVTLGGAVAADVHGKNHHAAGTFGQHVTELLLLTADGQLRRVSKGRESELFWATVGGMGLTGVIVEVSLRLVPVETGYLSVDYVRTGGLEETLEWFSGHDRNYPFTVAWLDGLKEGPSLGRAVLMGGRTLPRSDLTSGPEPYPMPRAAFGMPFDLPSGSLSVPLGRAFNAVYYGMHKPRLDVREPWWKFFYPLDVADDWFRLYGRRGFAQYQGVYPPEVGVSELRALLRRIHAAHHPNFLGVLKRMGPPSPGMLSFPREGLTLALDLPMQGEATLRLFRDLYAMTADYGGRVYLAKDAFLTRELFRRMYPDWEAFRAVKAKVDPTGKFRSLLSERLGLGEVD